MPRCNGCSADDDYDDFGHFIFKAHFENFSWISRLSHPRSKLKSSSMALKWDQSERSQNFRYKVTAVFVRGLFSKGVAKGSRWGVGWFYWSLNIQHNRAPLIKMTVWGSSLQIRCRLILLISEHPIQQGIRKECWHRIPGNGTEFLEKWRSLRKKVSLTPKKWKFGSKKKVFPRIHLDMDFLQKTASKLV